MVYTKHGIYHVISINDCDDDCERKYLKCIKKIYDKNKRITGYVLADKDNRQYTIEKIFIKSMIIKYNVVNLQIASDGRVVDKVIK